MKIGVFRRWYVPHGGGERFTHQLVQRLAAAGHEVHLFCQGWIDIPQGVRIHRVPKLAGGSTVKTLGYALLAPRLARRVGVTLVHSFERTFRQDLYRAGEGCHRQWLALRRQYLPGPLPSLDRARPFHWVTLSIERRICQGGGAKLIVVNSRMVERDLVTHYAPLRVGTALIRNGVDLDCFHPEVRAASRRQARQALGLAPDQFVLLTVGSGFRRKGVPTVLRALGHLSRQTTLAPIMLVAGKGNPNLLTILAIQEGVEKQLRILGTVQDTLSLYAAADLFVLPSVYDPASTATLEALATGLPVVTTTVNGTSEIIDHRRSGWLLEDPADCMRLARLIEEAADPHVRLHVGEAGRKAVESCTWERHLTETLALYRRFSAHTTVPPQ